MFGALHVLREEPTYATALTETDGVAYTLVRGLAQGQCRLPPDKEVRSVFVERATSSSFDETVDLYMINRYGCVCSSH